MKARWVIGSSLILGISGWLPIPLPTSLIERLAPEGISVSAEQVQLRWAPGTLDVGDLIVAASNAQSDSTILQLESAQLYLDLLPGKGFLSPRGLVLNHGQLNADELSALLSQSSDDLGGLAENKTPPTFKLELHQMRCTAPVAGKTTSFTVVDALGQAQGRQVKLKGSIVSDVGLSAEAWVKINLPDWSFDLVCPTAKLEGFDFLPADLRAESCRLGLHLSPKEKIIDFNLMEVDLNIPEPPLSFHLSEMQIAGSLSEGILMNANGRFEGTPMHANGWLGRNSDGLLAAHVTGDASAFVIDKKRTEWIHKLDPGAAEVFNALELRGAMPANFAWDWTAGNGIGSWLVHSKFDNSSLTYRGFLEDDGDQPSFPYPLEKLNGEFSVIGSRFLFALSGDMSEATAHGGGTVKLTNGPALLDIELEIDGLPIDARIRHALGGTPEAAAVWRDLGGPTGGHANLGLRLLRYADDPRVRVQLDGNVFGTTAKPSFLPIAITADDIHLNWRPGHAQFNGSIETLGGSFNIDGDARMVSDAELPAIKVLAESTESLAPELAERRVLEGFLALPNGAAEFSAAGKAKWKFALRRPGTSSQANLLLDIESEELMVQWDPVEIAWRQINGNASIAHAQKQSLISAPRLYSNCCGGELDASVIINTAADLSSSTAVVNAQNFGITPASVNFARALANLDPTDLEQLNWSGQLNLRAELAPLAAENNRGQITLAPLLISNAKMLPDQEVEVRGELALRDGGFFDGEFALNSSAGELSLSDFEFVAVARNNSPAGLRAILNSADGIEISDRFAELLSPEAWSAFQKIGLSGRIGAEDLLLSLSNKEDSLFTLNGDLLLKDINLLAPPGLAFGEARLRANEFSWSGPNGFGGELIFSDGQAQLAGLQLSDAQGALDFKPEEIFVSDFDAAFLGGRLSTNAPTLPALRSSASHENKLNLESGPQVKKLQGSMSLGLTTNAPIKLHLFLREANLNTLRDNLGIGGNLAGIIDCDINVNASSPSPMDYAGEIDLRIKDGALGTVPVLSEMWKVAGVDAPVFEKGRFLVKANRNAHRGRLRIERFTLNHKLLQVTGKGWIGLDSYLDLKATVRSALVPVLGWGVPIISDLFFDPLFEQDIMGPIANPKVAQRVLNKWSDGDQQHIPFPLWVPSVERADWRKSPAFAPATFSEPARD